MAEVLGSPPGAPRRNSHEACPRPFSLGAAVRSAKNGDLVVVSVIGDGPMGRAGVSKGDGLLALDGHRVSSLDEVAALLAACATRSSLVAAVRWAATGAEADVELRRDLSTGEKKSTGDVADVLRRIAAANIASGQHRASQSARGTSAGVPLADAPGLKEHSAQDSKPPPTARSAVLRDVSNTFVASPAGNKTPKPLAKQHSGEKHSWIVAFSPAPKSSEGGGGSCGSPGQKHAKTSALARQSPSSPSTKASPRTPSKVRFDVAVDSQDAATCVDAAGSLAGASTALTLAPPSSPGGRALSRSPNMMLPTISPVSQCSGTLGALHRSMSMSISPSLSGRSAQGHESFGCELQQMHSLIFQSGEAIASLKDELMNAQDSKHTLSIKCEQLQAAHDVLAQQHALYKHVLSSAAEQHKRLQGEIESLQDEKKAMGLALMQREEALARALSLSDGLGSGAVGGGGPKRLLEDLAGSVATLSRQVQAMQELQVY